MAYHNVSPRQSPWPPFRSPLTPHDLQVIADLQSGKVTLAKAKTAARIAKVKLPRWYPGARWDSMKAKWK